MAKYRQLHTEFWSDGFVLDLTPEEKFFYLYLMSNSKTSQCGVYELPLRVIEMETGYNRETVIKLLKRFEEYRKIKYSENTKEIMIFNWAKYNIPNNINAIKCVNREIKNIKNKDFIKLLYIKYYKLKLDIKNLFDGVFVFEDKKEPLKRGSQNIKADLAVGNEAVKTKVEEDVEGEKALFQNKDLTSDKGSEEDVFEDKDLISDEEVVFENKAAMGNEEEGVIRNKDAINKEEDIVSISTFEDVVTFFKKNICNPKDFEYKKLKEWSSSINCDVIIMAITESIKYNVKTMKYIENVLYSWEEKGLKTKKDVEVYKKKWEGNKKYNSSSKDNWDVVEQRDYDFKDLERKLLGWDKEKS